MRDCILQVDSLSPDEQDQTQFIMTSEQMTTWLHGKRTSLLDLDPQTPPTNLANSLSFTSARLLVALRSLEKYPGLGFFCRSRNTYSSSETKSGPVALVRSLNGQLLEFIAKHKTGLDLSQIEKSLLAKAESDTDYGLTLFRELLILLEEAGGPDTSVFIVIDSLSCLSGKPRESHELMEELWKIIRHRKGLVIKVLVTDALVSSPVKGIATLSLRVPDLVDTTGVMDGEGEMAGRVGGSIR